MAWQGRRQMKTTQPLCGKTTIQITSLKNDNRLILLLSGSKKMEKPAGLKFISFRPLTEKK
jgi:hypothetical protein